jgi:hypothetical protein
LHDLAELEEIDQRLEPWHGSGGEYALLFGFAQIALVVTRVG